MEKAAAANCSQCYSADLLFEACAPTILALEILNTLASASSSNAGLRQLTREDGPRQYDAVRSEGTARARRFSGQSPYSFGMKSATCGAWPAR